MGLFDIFRKKSPAREDYSKVDLALDDLMVGCMVDYDLKTWQVAARHYTDWGEGDKTHEWQLKSYDDLIYLERSEDDEVQWCISRKINFNRLGSEIPERIKDSGDPPQTVTYESVSYYLEESGGGHFFKDGRPPGQPMLSWDYADDSGRRFLTIEQWGEDEFEASLGETVEDYQFTNILPPQSH